MKRFLLRIIADIKQGNNIDLVVTLTLAIIVVTLNILGITSVNLVWSFTLATLALITINLLISRHKMEDIYRKENTKNTIQFYDYEIDKLKGFIQESNEIWMIGLTLRNTTTDNYYYFRKKVKKGLVLRTIIVDLNTIDLKMAVKRFSRAGNKKGFLNDMNHVIFEYRDISKGAPNSKNVRLRLLNFIPSFSMYLFPDKNNNGIAFIENYCYKSPKGSLPKFMVTERNNPDWYKHFIDQFELMWKDSNEINLKIK